jgi:hypothetical protein
MRHRRRADGAPAGVERKRDAQHIAQRGADEIDLAPARRAQEMMRADAGAAYEAARRHDQVGAGRQRGAHGRNGSAGGAGLRRWRLWHGHGTPCYPAAWPRDRAA